MPQSHYFLKYPVGVYIHAIFIRMGQTVVQRDPLTCYPAHFVGYVLLDLILG